MEFGVAFTVPSGLLVWLRAWFNRRIEIARKAYPGGEWIIELDRRRRPVFRDTGVRRSITGPRPIESVDGRAFIRVDYTGAGPAISDLSGHVAGPDVGSTLVFLSLQREAFDLMQSLPAGRRRHQKEWVR